MVVWVGERGRGGGGREPQIQEHCAQVNEYERLASKNTGFSKEGGGGRGASPIFLGPGFRTKAAREIRKKLAREPQ